MSELKPESYSQASPNFESPEHNDMINRQNNTIGQLLCGKIWNVEIKDPKFREEFRKNMVEQKKSEIFNSMLLEKIKLEEVVKFHVPSESITFKSANDRRLFILDSIIGHPHQKLTDSGQKLCDQFCNLQNDLINSGLQFDEYKNIVGQVDVNPVHSSSNNDKYFGLNGFKKGLVPFLFALAQ